MCYTRAALALNIVIGGSVGNVTADQFLTVQDNDLTTKVRHIKLPDFFPAEKVSLVSNQLQQCDQRHHGKIGLSSLRQKFQH